MAAERSSQPGTARSRRRFLGILGAGGVAAVVGSSLQSCGSEQTSRTGPPPEGGRRLQAAPGDTDVVNFLLLLEGVELDFYRQVAASEVIQEASVADLFARVARNEDEHVSALSGSIRRTGALEVERPSTNFDAVLKGGPEEVLSTAVTLENALAAAYLGQLSRIEDVDGLTLLLSIHSVKGRQAAALSMIAQTGFQSGDRFTGSIPDGAFAKPIEMDEALEAIDPFIAR